MINILKNIPNVKTYPLIYVFEKMKLKHKPDTLWLEFGVASGRTINYISKFTNDKVYGFDSFEGLPEKWRDGFDKGAFSRNGNLPKVNDNVELIKGWFDDTLPKFIEKHNNKKVSFIHTTATIFLQISITTLTILLYKINKIVSVVIEICKKIVAVV
jgi:hypothetical protein